MNNEQQKSKNSAQIIWGLALVVAGVAMFIKIPKVLPQLAQTETYANTIELWAIRLCLYLVGIILIGGGAQKIIHQFKLKRSGSLDDPGDTIDG